MIGGEMEAGERGSTRSPSTSVQGRFALPLASYRESYLLRLVTCHECVELRLGVP
jgi:hypothetical protein